MQIVERSGGEGLGFKLLGLVRLQVFDVHVGLAGFGAKSEI